MLSQERFQFILKELKKHGTVTVTGLADTMKISESTIRRDLAQLDTMGKLEKVHGGATALAGEVSTVEEAMNVKNSQNVEEKVQIARYAAALVKDEDFVYLDAGTTTSRMIDYLGESKAVFVTNGINHAAKLAGMGRKVFVVGGQLRTATEAIVGTGALDQLKKYNFTKVFLGANGVSTGKGFTTPDIEEALMKKTALEQGASCYVLADHTKFSRISSVTFGNLEDACIISDRLVDDKYKKTTQIIEVDK